jgi:ABC-type nitrate/sulfonate/bicarbonate transport system substrate-binding protein
MGEIDNIGSGLSRVLTRRQWLMGAAAVGGGAVLGGGLLEACATQASSIGSTKLDEVTFAVGADPGYFHYIVAIKKQLLKPYGINGTSSFFSTGSDALDSVLTGTSDVGGGGELSSLVRRLKGGKIYTVGRGAHSGKHLGIVVHANVKTPSDLEGKKIGLQFGTSAQNYIQLYQQEYALNASKMQIINVDAASQAAALSRGDIDVSVIWEPWRDKMLQIVPGTHVLALSGDNGLYPVNIDMYFGQRLINNQDLGARALKGIIAGAKWISDPANIAEASAITSAAIKVDAATAKSYIQKIWTYNVEWPGDMQSMFDVAVTFDKTLKDKSLDQVTNWNTFYADFLRPDELKKAAPYLF